MALSSHLEELRKKHQSLSDAVEAAQRAPASDDLEIARLKNCGELKKAGIYFHPKSPYYKVCADVIVTNPGGVIPPHKHSIPSPSTSLSRGNESAAQLGAPIQIRQEAFSP